MEKAYISLESNNGLLSISLQETYKSEGLALEEYKMYILNSH